MTALIIGVRGQTGSYLAEQLTDAGHDVWGLARPGAPATVRTVDGDVRDPDSITAALRKIRPDVVYNTAAVTAPGGAWGTVQPVGLLETTGTAVRDLLDAVQAVVPDARVVHVSSSAVFDPHRYGLYGVAKWLAHQTVIGYRTGWGLRASNAVVWSHTSPRQDSRFLARVVCRQAAAVAAGLANRVVLTNGANRRDWGYAGDYAEALACLATAPAGDYRVATGETHSVRDLADAAAHAAGVPDRVCDTSVGTAEPAETPPADTDLWDVPGWTARTPFAEWVDMIVRADLASL